MTTDPNLPNYQHPSYVDSHSALQFIQDMWVGKSNWYRYGDDEIYDLDKCQKYLHRESEEPLDAYVGRLKRSRFERRFRNAIEKDYSGLLSQFIVQNIPLSMQEYLTNIDLRGNSLNLFLKEADKLALRDKYCFVMVEYPSSSPVKNEAERRNKGVRPYLVLLPRVAVINWEYESTLSGVVLTRLVFKKEEYIKDGLYGFSTRELYYLLEPGSYRAFEIDDEDNVFIAKDSEDNEIVGDTSLDFIPVVPYSLTDINLLDSDISFPLGDLAELNLELYQLESEKRDILHKCNMPSLLVDRRTSDGFLPPENTGHDLKTIIGTNTVNYDCDMEWVEPTGKAIAATQQDIANLNERIDDATLSFLSGGNYLRTATEVKVNATKSRSNFINMAITKESNFTEIANIWAKYEGEQEDDWAISLDRNLFKTPLDLTVTQVQDLYLTGIISHSLCLNILRNKKVFGDDFTPEQLEEELTTENLQVNNRDGVNSRFRSIETRLKKL